MSRDGFSNMWMRWLQTTRDTRANPKTPQGVPIAIDGAPPNREIEHIIEVEPREKPANIKPYRYPHHHKIEIKIFTQDLLRCGVISKN